MVAYISTTFQKLADVSTAGNDFHSYIIPLVYTLCGLGSLAAVFFLINGGIAYITSSGKPANLEHAKQVIKNALIGLILILGAVTLTTILSHAYTQPHTVTGSTFPTLTAVQPKSTSVSLTTVLIKAITGVLASLITTAGEPFLKALSYFTSGTPLMGDNGTVFNLWLAILGIADVAFILVVILLGFHVMSASTLGFDELDIKQLLPRIGAVFLLMNCSLFVVDMIIGLCNAMIHAITLGFPTANVWTVLTDIANGSGALGLAALMVMIVFLILAVILLVYYVGRLVTLYIGAALSPLVFMMLLIPGFKDFALNAIKTYISTIFVLFVHVVILILAASIFAGLVSTNDTHTADPIMALVVGLATIIALLKTQGLMMQFSYASIGPKTARKLGSQFVNSVSLITSKTRAVTSSVSTARAAKGLTPTMRPSPAFATAGIAPSFSTRSMAQSTTAGASKSSKAESKPSEPKGDKT